MKPKMTIVELEAQVAREIERASGDLSAPAVRCAEYNLWEAKQVQAAARKLK